MVYVQQLWGGEPLFEVLRNVDGYQIEANHGSLVNQVEMLVDRACAHRAQF